LHPADQLRGTSSDKLSGRKIVLGVTGSIAAVECVRLCRELVRHGADVHVVMSKDAQMIIHPYSMEFASGNPVTVEIDGKVQHVSFCGDVPERADLLLIAPATANTISKIACGIDDTTVTTFATTALGTGIPIMIVPAMHGTMIRHPAVKENLERLRSFGVDIIQAGDFESKIKMPSIDHIVSAATRAVGKPDLAGRRVLVIAGSTEEPLDDIRMITNRSSGETGVELARAAYERGADVELWMGRCEAGIPDMLKLTRYRTFKDLGDLIRRSDLDIVLFPAAVSDYTPDKVDGKLSSDEESKTITLRRNPKLIDGIRAGIVVGFKAQSHLDREALLGEARALLERSKCALVVANNIEDVGPGKTRVTAVLSSGEVQELEGTKADVARKIIDLVARMIS